ncbi:hypothetical protein Pint_19235 [Pistacia integerrima]|uniref:Uncharacterized protein n=1 Tax=Pistacia integerrima TaxID=434235 RepID=A0ACC0YZ97_9ROSI|nr:hypothetical protein Pint_19235 [Pistacia integerrima]
MFFADKRVVTLLSKLLGKHFFKKRKKIPVPVDLKHKNWKEQIEKVCGSALLYLRTGTCSVLKVGKVSMDAKEIVENVMAAINGIAEIVPGNVRSLHLKMLESLALPVYQAVGFNQAQAELARRHGRNKNSETRIFSLTDFLNSVPKCVFSSYSTPVLTDLETNLVKSILQDDKDQLINIIKQALLNGNDNDTLQTTASAAVLKILHLCCNLDSVFCATALVNGELLGGAAAAVNKTDSVTGLTAIHVAAESHAARCVEMLLKKRARTAVKSKDGRGRLALELSLSSSRMDVIWNPDDYSVEDLVVILSQKDLTTVKLLSEKTKEISEVAYASAVGGRVVELAALLIVAAESVNSSLLVLHDADSGCKEETTIYECVVKEALSLGRTTTSCLRAAKRSSAPTKSESAKKRKLLLCEIELLQLFGAVSNRSCTDKKVTSPLILAAQAGDEAVMELLLKSNTDVNDTDAEGNAALHFALKASMGSCQHVQQNRIVGLLLKHGARVNQKNKLGLTAVHLAAASGNLQALEALMKETPLFFAAKNDHMDCAELLLRQGANSEVLNLRRERPIDLAVSQDMRFLLNAANICHRDEISETCEALLSMTEEGTNIEKMCSNVKPEICKYFESPSGCVRGAKCFYAHGVQELRKTKRGANLIHSATAEDFKRKIFVGGLPISLDSDSLSEFFEEHFGPVENAKVARFQTGKQIQSRGFGFITFAHEESVSEAVEARYVTIMGRKVEIKSAIPKFLVLAELQKQAGRRQEATIKDQSQLQAVMPDKKTTEDMSARKIEEEMPSRKNQEDMPCRETLEEEKPEHTSWADRLLLCQPMTSATESQADISTSFGGQNMPKWLRIFKRWLPRFLQHQYKPPIEGEYALSSLKADFKAAFQLEMDHASLGYPKLSDFMRTFPDICTMNSRTLSKNGSPNHMVLLPSSIPKPKLKVLQQLKMHSPPFPVKSIGDGDDSDSCDSKSPQDLPSASSASTGFTTGSIEGNSSHEVTEDSSTISRRGNSAQRSTSSGVPQKLVWFTKPGMFSDSCDSKSPQDLPSASSASTGFTTSSNEGNSSHEITEDSSTTSRRGNSAQRSTSSGVPQRLVWFTKPGMFSFSQTSSHQGGDEGSGDPNDRRRWMEPSEGIKLILHNRHVVLQWLAIKRKNSSVLFLREFDFYPKYKANLLRGLCFGCNRQKMMWGNFPCKHLLWCGNCKLEAEQIGRYDHKCVVCDMEVQKINLILSNQFEEFRPLYNFNRPEYGIAKPNLSSSMLFI